MAIDQKVLGYETHDKGIKFNQEALKKNMSSGSSTCTREGAMRCNYWGKGQIE